MPGAVTNQSGPMNIGVMSDLHGNPLAVSAVIDDAADAGIDRWLVLGDNFAMGPDPKAVLDLLDRLPLMASVLGNTERYILTGDCPEPTLRQVAADPDLLPRLVEVVASFAWTKGYLAATARLDGLRSYVPNFRSILADGTRLLAVHASYISDDGPGIAPETTDEVLREVFKGAGADLILGGHTHESTDRRLDGARFVNPGSVSNPPTADKSGKYCVIRSDRGGFEIEHRSVVYDYGAVEEMIEQSGIPGAGFLIDQYFS